MLSHLRFHRRGPSTSNPTSPLPEQAPAWDATAAAAASAAQREHPHQSPHDVSPRPDARQRSPTSSNFPPTLPPIARVASTGSDHLFAPIPHDEADAPPPPETRPPPPRSTYDEEAKAGFIGGVALENYRKAAQAPQANVPAATATMAGQLPDTQLSRAKPPPPPIDTGVASRPPIQASRQAKSSWFSTPTDLQLGQGAANKRPSGTRLASEPPLVAQSEPQKGRKGLPFLKNPMTSLLMRRKTAQSAADTQPPAPTYDPRIKGTRVHDFSAPRPRKTVSSDGTSLSTEGASSTPAATGDGVTALTPTESPGGVDVTGDGQTFPGAPAEPGRKISSGTVPSERSVLLAAQNDGTSMHTTSSTVSRGTQTVPQSATGSASVRTTASRHLSASRVSRQGSAASAIPKHMKSTSSRFSFDMIGAAEEERLLEERHRQREQERKTDGPDGRFDEFDDDFDYDAMMDDDGLEERIPGVNADYEEEDYLDDPEAEFDPDNDQENFAGFTFQRSNPVSSITSPISTGMLATPRDAAGNVVGFAMTKDPSPGLLSPNLDFIVPGTSGVKEQAPEYDTSDTVGGFAPSQHYPATSMSQPPLRSHNDDIYFDDGLADELDFEHDGTVFDESIFDNNDTDKYGRPIPGAFAQAKEAMQAAYQQQFQQEPEPEVQLPVPEIQDTQPQEQPQQVQSQKAPDSNRDSDITSGSVQSAPAQSTGQTSISVGLPQDVNQADHEDLSLSQQISEPGTEVPGQDMMYQAALAEAAQMAAASGKFFRSTSPDVLAGLKDAPTDELAGYEDEDPSGGYIDDYADDDVENNFDDFDFDDDAIIAEANASALANDSDGFYGQEFGFYSAPVSQQPSSNSHQPSSSGVLTTENLFQYGGFFGPASANINRSASGRVVREPNLTPITERSEYSNRNSIMSFTLPPAIGNGGSDRNSLTSPGLAQLALLAADDNDSNMSLTALMKLRSRAWGGSQPSLVSSREGSPRSERAPMQMPLDGSAAGGSPFGTVPAHLAGHVRVGSGLSLWSCSEDAEDANNAKGVNGLNNSGLIGSFPTGTGPGDILPPRPGSAGAAVNGSASTSIMNGLGSLPQRPHSLFLPPQTPMTAPLPGTQPPGMNPLTCSPVLERDELEPGPTSPVPDGFALAPALPVRRSEDLAREAATSAELSQHPPQQQQSPPVVRRAAGSAAGMGHRHKGSADSISYRKDEEGGETKWVVERRRTSESGEVEILGRDVLQGGRI